MQKSKPKDIVVLASRSSACIAVSVMDENVTGVAINYAVDQGNRVVTLDSDAPYSKRAAFGGQYVVITSPGPNSKLRIDGIRSALQHSQWFEGKPPLLYGEASDTQAIQLMTGLAENPEIDGMISTEGWPMDNSGSFREFSKKYGSKKKL